MWQAIVKSPPFLRRALFCIDHKDNKNTKKKKLYTCILCTVASLREINLYSPHYA